MSLTMTLALFAAAAAVLAVHLGGLAVLYTLRGPA